MLKPLENRILLVAEEQIKSLVLRPETKEKDRPTKGKIVALGKKYEGEAKVGDTVYFLKFNVESIESGGKEYFVAIPEDLLAIEK